MVRLSFLTCCEIFLFNLLGCVWRHMNCLLQVPSNSAWNSGKSQEILSISCQGISKYLFWDYSKWCRNWTEHKIKKSMKIPVKVQLLRFYSRAFGAELLRHTKEKVWWRSWYFHAFLYFGISQRISYYKIIALLWNLQHWMNDLMFNSVSWVKCMAFFMPCSCMKSWTHILSHWIKV
jgi:hypothetical protein